MPSWATISFSIRSFLHGIRWLIRHFTRREGKVAEENTTV
jgi:hypothetical protein